MTKRKNELVNTIFGQLFMGQEVEIIVNVNHKIMEETEVGIMTQEAPLMLKGYLLDIDEEYYYLGSTPEEISSTIKRSYVVNVEMVKYKNEFEEILDSLPTPSRGNGN